MNCKYVQDNYQVPACIGRVVIVDGKSGVITEDRGNYIGVTFDEDKAGVVSNCHPTWEVEYRGMDLMMGRVANRRQYAHTRPYRINE
jgi:hypothetical protein